MAAAFALAGPGEAAAESLGDLYPDATSAEALWGVELRPARPAQGQPLTITIDFARQAMQALLSPGTEWIRLPSQQPHELGDQVTFALAAHTEPASATAVNGVPAVTVDGGMVTILTSRPADGKAIWSAVELPRAYTPVPYGILPRRGRRGS